jgi:hypothetical protein
VRGILTLLCHEWWMMSCVMLISRISSISLPSLNYFHS